MGEWFGLRISGEPAEIANIARRAMVHALLQLKSLRRVPQALKPAAFSCMQLIGLLWILQQRTIPTGKAVALARQA